MSAQRLTALVATTTWMLVASAHAAAQDKDLPIMPTAPRAGLPPHVLPRIEERYQALLKQGSGLTSAVERHRAECDRVLNTPAALGPCQRQAESLRATWGGYNRERDAYAALHEKMRGHFSQPSYQVSGRGLILGLTQLGGFNVPPSASPDTVTRVRREQTRRLADMQQRAGIPPERRAITEGYNFILGFALTPAVMLGGDIPWVNLPEIARALADSYRDGDFSASSREVYASLKGRYFDILECHSNGAMVCLSALRRGDVAAKSVRLLGPQLSKAALAEWQWLIEQGLVNRVTIYAMTYDPIPYVALAYSAIVEPSRSWTALRELRNVLLGDAPAIETQSFDCPVATGANIMKCHALPLYQRALAGAR